MKRTLFSLLLALSFSATTLFAASSNPAVITPSDMALDNSVEAITEVPETGDALICLKKNRQGDTVFCMFCNCRNQPQIPTSPPPVDQQENPNPNRF